MTHGIHFKRMRRQDQPGGLLSATITPLASIFGSGFLVIVGLLADAVGPYSVFAMLGICLVAYAIGAIIRYNIAHVEPLLAKGGLSHAAHFCEIAADIALVPAYVISVTLYLRILASFALGELGADTNINENLVVSGCIVVIMAIAWWRGLTSLEFTEKWALVATLCVVAALFAVFVSKDAVAIAAGAIILPKPTDQTIWHILAVLGGAVIVVQGFETTRYLGEHYSTETRIKANRYSQIISTIVYILFVAAASPQIHLLGTKASDSGLLLIVQKAAPFMALPLVGAAIFSQFSAAVADTIGGAGNIRDRTDAKIPHKWVYTAILGVALVLTWTSDTQQILVLASRAFALYYAIQCVVTFLVSCDIRIKSGSAVVGLLMFAIAVFAVPAG